MMFRLADASVTIRPTNVVLTWTTSGVQPTRGALTLSTTFVSQDGSSIRQLGFKLLDGIWVTTFSFDHATASVWKQRNYSTRSPSRTANVWTVAFPAEALGSVGSGNWHADLDVAGVDGGTVRGAVA